MTKIKSFHLKTYTSPTESAFRCRKIFYSTTKLINESINDWFQRTEENISGCDFGELSDFMLIDKFISGLNEGIFDKFALQSTLTTEQALSIALTFDLLANELAETKTEPIYSLDDFLQVEIIKNEESSQQLLQGELSEQGYAIHKDERYFIDNNIQSECSFKNGPKTRQNNMGSIAKNKNKKSKNKQKRSNECVELTEYQPQVDSNRDILGFEIDEQKRIVCLDCGKSFAIKGSYNIHRRIHTGKNLHGCNICGRVFTMRSKLKRHMPMHANEGKTFECYMCSFKFNHLHTLKTHLTLKHVASKRDELQCTYCEKKYLSAKTFQIHMKVHQGITKSHKCPHCDRIFDRRNHMLIHAAVHSDFRQFICETCGKSFKTTKHLSNHMRRHTGERPYKCNECGKTLKSSHTYNNHMRLHTGERPHKCTLCEKTFVQRPNLLKHLMVHRKEKPHGCTMCEKRFATTYHMRLHMSVHTGAKPYKCNINMCDKAFTQPGTLKAHQEKCHITPMEMAPVPIY